MFQRVLLFVVVCGLSFPAIAAFEPTPAPGDPFLCYRAKRSGGSICSVGTPSAGASCETDADCGGAADSCRVNSKQDLPTVALESALDGLGNFATKKMRSLCAAGALGAGSPSDADTHLEMFQIKRDSSTAKHQRRAGIRVHNELGEVAVDTIKASHLLVPTALDLAAPVVAPDPVNHDIDHFKCYKAKSAKGFPKLQKGLQLEVSDFFSTAQGTAPQRYDVKKVSQYCEPVDKNGEGIQLEDKHLLCYRVKLAKKFITQPPAPGDKGTLITPEQPKHTPISGLFGANQFGVEHNDTKKESELCLPSVRLQSFARQISDPADLITGPLAHSRVGDFLLENRFARYIIQDATPIGPGGISDRDLHSVDQFGGNIIDAEVVGRPGRDNFLEIQPGVTAETVINAQTVEVLNDGSDGSAAIVRACGPDDILDFINPSTNVREFGFELPAYTDDMDYDITGCTEYILEPDKPYLRLVTSIMNHEAGDLGLLVGDVINAAGEVDPWFISGAGVGELFIGTMEGLSYIGSGDASGVTYNYSFEAHPDSDVPTSDIISTAGVTVVAHSNSLISVIGNAPPKFVVPAGGSNQFIRYFSVGSGSGTDVISLNLDIAGEPTADLEGCVTVGGVPAPNARVAVGLLDAGEIDGLIGHFVTDEVGCYAGTLPPGSYGVAAWREGTPYEGGASTPTIHLVTLTENTTTQQDVALPATGRLEATIRDESNSTIPARLTVLGFDASPDLILPYSLFPGLLPSSDTGVFLDGNSDGTPFGVARVVYAGADGQAQLDLEPGTYGVVASRGTEYSNQVQTVVIPDPAVDASPVTLNLQIARVLNTPGFVSSDFHVHGLLSADSRVNQRNRVMQFAGEGVDNIVMTEHNAHNDLTSTIASLGLTNFVHSTVGEEITTWDYGHFNGYPFLVDPSRQSGGSTDWGRPAAPGMDFAVYGSYIATPAELDQLAQTGPLSTPDTVVQVNHIGSYYNALKIDSAQVPPQSNLSAAELAAARLDPSAGNIFHHFPALEVWNGDSRGAQNTFLNDRIGVWFNQLNQGLLTTALGDTDTHGFRNLNGAGAATWTSSSTDLPPSISDAEIAQAIEAGRAVSGQGIYVQARLEDAVNASLFADFSLGGSTLVDVPSGNLKLVIDIQSPLWAEYDRIEIYQNATTTATGNVPLDDALGGGTVSTEYSATPNQVLQLGPDFTRSQVNVVPAVPGAERYETHLEVPISVAADTWFVVLVRGSDGTSKPMFPVFPDSLSSGSNSSLADLLDGNLGENGTMALGFTNALYANVDGIAGFNAPNAP